MSVTENPYWKVGEKLTEMQLELGLHQWPADERILRASQLRSELWEAIAEYRDWYMDVGRSLGPKRAA